MITYDVDAEGIATLSWDLPGRRVNVMNRESLAAFAAAVERALADESVRGVIVTSAKTDFIAGADLEAFADLGNAAEIMGMVTAAQGTLRRLETGGKPVVAAINGTALGGGCEIALACHYRVAARRDDMRIGLPEVTLGLLPGAGGTQRLPRMLGARAALPLLLEGKRLRPEDAFAAGLVDALAAPEDLLPAARRWLHDAPTAVKPWDKRGFKLPGGTVQSPQGYEIFVAGNAMTHAKTRGNYPAALAILSCVYEGLQVPIDVGLRIEARYFTGLLRSPEARGMIRTLFFSRTQANRLDARPKDVPAAALHRVGVLGAGMMGAGIAYVSALAGLDVVLLDVTRERAEAGKAKSAVLLDAQVKRGRHDAAFRETTLARIRPTVDYADLAGVDLVIEAVIEDRAVKAEVTAQAEAVIGADAIFASNTSTLPITGLAASARRPENFIGMHFFSPVHRMPLVEIIPGAATSPRCLAKALDVAKRLGKTPIIVGDGRGFFTSRVFATYLMEGFALLAEGVAPALIENAGRLAGMPLGPLALADEVSLALNHHILAQTRADLGDAYAAGPGDAVIATMVETLGRAGKAAGRGFYEYPAGGRKRLWPDLGRHFPCVDSQPEVAAIQRRLLHIQAVETARCIADGVITDPRDADLGSVLGWGFAPFTGGVVSYMDGIGVGEFVDQCAALAQRHGPRFAPPEPLRRMAKDGRSFYHAARFHEPA